ncbi:MAG TPA: carbohydrate-binding protein, partial [Cytophagales bacterium]|nr:carbohydrate-binding protein [Cytophagales bacterium]
MKYKFILLLLFCCVLTIEGFSQTVAVGSGSYTTTFPGTDQAGRNTFPSGTPNLSGVAATKPVPTNDWWSSFMKNNHGSGAFNYPLAYRSKTSGLSINYIVPNPSPIEYRQPMSDVDGVIVGVNNLNAAKSTVSNHSDWTVTLNWTGSGNFNATMGVGMPFTYFTKGSGDLAKVTVGFNPQNATVSGNKIIIQNNQNGANYVVYGPAGTVWSGSGGVYTSNLNGKNYWSMAMLPPGANVTATATDFEKYAFVFPGNTQVSWNYNSTNGQVRSTFSVTPDVKEGVNNVVLQGLLPHQWSRLAGDSPQPTALTYSSVRGQLKMLASNSFIVQNRFSGILPNLPNLAKYSAGFDPGSLYKKIDMMKNDGLAEWTDSYNEGQGMNRLIQAAHIAHQIGHTEARDKLVNTVKARLEDWFKAEGGEVAFLFYYNNDWKALIGYPAGHSQDVNLNDHHFHWGYFIHAAAAIEQYQPGWAANWGPMVNLLIRDAASTDRNDSMFPFLRNFNPYQGHAWANGTANQPFGNDQESTSESMQFNSSLIHWGTITGNTAIRDLGIFLYTTEQSAVEEYWFDVNDRTFHSSYEGDMVARIWGGGYDNGTWWTNDIAASYGIQLYPIHGGALYMGHNTAYVQKIWNSMKTKTQVLQNTPNDNLWYDIYWSFLSFLDPAEAINLYNAYPDRNVKFGVSDAQTYHWLHTMNAMGQVAEEVTSNYPIAAVFNKSGVKTYVAHNYGASAVTVSFSDGYSMSVPARSTKTNRDINAAATLSVNTLQVPKNGTVNLTANVTGSGITKVDFYRNSTLISSDASAPYAATASNLTAGMPNFYARAYVGSNHNVSNVITVQVGSQVPYSGVPIAIPGTIEAGHYDAFEGGSGQGVSYSDATSWNEGNFRTSEAVDAGTTTSEGVTVGWIDAGEWLEYTINAAQAGTYDVTLRYTSGNATGGGPFWFENEAGAKISPEATVTMNDVNWTAYVDKIVTGVSLSAGTQIIRFKAGSGGFNLGKMTFVYKGGGDTQAPTVPPSLTATSKTENSVSLSWSPSTDNVEVAGYEVFVGSESTPRATVTSTSATIGSLTANTAYSFKVRARDAANNFSAFTNSLVVTTNSSTPTGQPIPGTIQAESYTSMSGVQEEGTQDGGPGENVGWIDAGDWMEYDVNVASSGTYAVGFRVASEPGGGQFQLRNAAGTSLATVNVAATGGWQVWTTLNANVSLTSGAQKIRIHAIAGGFNLNWMQFSTSGDTQAPTAPSNLASPSKTISSVNLTWSASTDNVEVTGYEVYVGTESTPRATVTGTSATIGSLSAGATYSFKVRAKDLANNFSGYSASLSVTTNTNTPTGQPIPGTIQAESYTAMSGVQKETTQDGGPGENVGYIESGDWMEYDVNVASAGSYSVGFRVASEPGGGQFQLRNAAGTSLATVSVGATGGWQVWTTLNANVSLSAGAQKIRIHATAPGFNVNWMAFTTACNPTAITPHLSVNGGAWQQTSTATLTAGGSVIFGPQPGTGGSWSWTGP